MREQAPGAKLLHDSVPGASSLVCTEICFAGACFRSKLLRVYWLEYLPGSVFRERVSGASSLVCTGLKPSVRKIVAKFSLRNVISILKWWIYKSS